MNITEDQIKTIQRIADELAMGRNGSDSITNNMYFIAGRANARLYELVKQIKSDQTESLLSQPNMVYVLRSQDKKIIHGIYLTEEQAEKDQRKDPMSSIYNFVVI